jgi:hypothetical protein
MTKFNTLKVGDFFKLGSDFCKKMSGASYFIVNEPIYGEVYMAPDRDSEIVPCTIDGKPIEPPKVEAVPVAIDPSTEAALNALDAKVAELEAQVSIAKRVHKALAVFYKKDLSKEELSEVVRAALLVLSSVFGPVSHTPAKTTKKATAKKKAVTKAPVKAAKKTTKKTAPKKGWKRA